MITRSILASDLINECSLTLSATNSTPFYERLFCLFLFQVFFWANTMFFKHSIISMLQKKNPRMREKAGSGNQMTVTRGNFESLLEPRGHENDVN